MQPEGTGDRINRNPSGQPPNRTTMSTPEDFETATLTIKVEVALYPDADGDTSDACEKVKAALTRACEEHGKVTAIDFD